MKWTYIGARFLQSTARSNYLLNVLRGLCVRACSKSAAQHGQRLHVANASVVQQSAEKSVENCENRIGATSVATKVNKIKTVH